MRNELKQELVNLFPTWFNTSGGAPHNPMLFGFQCGDGWYPLLLRLCVDLKPMVAKFERETGEHFEVVQVKVKFGTLRFYVSHHSAAVSKRIAEAQMESSRTCETCGQPARWHEGDGWVRVRCDEHGLSYKGLNRGLFVRDSIHSG